MITSLTDLTSAWNAAPADVRRAFLHVCCRLYREEVERALERVRGSCADIQRPDNDRKEPR